MFRHRGYPSQGLTEQTNVSPKRYSTCDTALLSFWHQTIHYSKLIIFMETYEKYDQNMRE